MWPMTNPTHPDQSAIIPPEILSLAPVGGKRRPVKVVWLPAFRAARARLDVPFTALRLPVVSLNRAPARVTCASHLPLHEAA